LTNLSKILSTAMFDGAHAKICKTWRNSAIYDETLPYQTKLYHIIVIIQHHKTTPYHTIPWTLPYYTKP
jgi:hypothetical protein